MRKMLKKSARKVVLAAVLTILFTVGSVSVLANTLTYLGEDSDGNQYTLSCGSSAGDYIVVYNPSSKTYTFYATQCS